MIEDCDIIDHLMPWGCKCTQRHRSSSWVDNLRKHLKEHSGDITNKCDHGGEKSKMCKLCCFICYDQGPGSTRYSTQTWNFLSYSNSTRTKHYSNRVVSIINSIFTIISTIIQKQPAMAM